MRNPSEGCEGRYTVGSPGAASAAGTATGAGFAGAGGKACENYPGPGEPVETLQSSRGRFSGPALIALSPPIGLAALLIAGTWIAVEAVVRVVSDPANTTLALLAGGGGIGFAVAWGVRNVRDERRRRAPMARRARLHAVGGSVRRHDRAA